MSMIATAQQESFMSYYDDGITAINPGAFRPEQMSGHYSLFARFGYRQQWLGFNFAPSTMQVQVEGWLPGYDYLFGTDGATRVGVHLTVDDSDPLMSYNAYGQLAQQIKLGERTFISLGGNLGFISYRFDPRNLDEDPNLIPDSHTTLDAGAGVLFAHYNDDDDPWGFFLGFSAPHVLGIDLNFERDDESLQVERVRHYYFTVGGALGDREGWRFRFKPTIVAGYLRNAPLYVDTNLEFQLSPNGHNTSQQVWIGVGAAMGQSAIADISANEPTYQFTTSSVSFRVGVNMPYNDNDTGAFRVGIGYTFPLGEILKLGNTYEITLSWMLADDY